MKGKTQSKPSKASLAARGLSTNPRVTNKSVQPKRVQKTARETNPGYALYATDSDADQVASVNHGLDRCAVLLSNILNHESKDNKQRNPESNHGKLPKTFGKKGTKTSQVLVKRAAHQRSKSTRSGPLVVPTAPQDCEASPSPAGRPASSQQPARSVRSDATPHYNERLVSSTPVLTSDQRHKQQELKQREAKLHQQIETLKEHYNLLQQQRSPEHQEQQKLKLQHSLLRELDDHQVATPAGEAVTAKTRSHSYTDEAQAVLSAGAELLSGARKSSARRSLDYTSNAPENGPLVSPRTDYMSNAPEKGPLMSPRTDYASNAPTKGPLGSPRTDYASNALTKGPLGSPRTDHASNAPTKGPLRSPRTDYASDDQGRSSRTDGNDINHEHAVDEYEPGGARLTEDVRVAGGKENVFPVSTKRVQIISPRSEQLRDGLTSPRGMPLRDGLTFPRGTPLRDGLTSSPVAVPRSSPLRTPPSASVATRMRGTSPQFKGGSSTSVENQVRVVQYLAGELSALLGNVGDLEVDRLLMEIDQATRLLPYLVNREQPEARSVDEALALQPLRMENAELRRKMRLANQKVKEQESLLKNIEDRNDGKTDLTFELAACRSVSAVLQKQLTEEKDNKDRVVRNNDQLTQTVLELQEEKKKLLQILSNKEQDYSNSKRKWRQETSRHETERELQTGELEAKQLSLEAVKKESRIFHLTLKQKDAEIERLKELTRGLQQSLSRLLADLQQHQPNGVLKGKSPEKATALEGLQEILNHDQQRSTHRTRPSSLSRADAAMAGSTDVSSAWPQRREWSRRESPHAVHLSESDEQPWQTRESPSPKPQKMLRFAEDVAFEDRMSSEAFHRNSPLESLDTGAARDSFGRSSSVDDISSLSSRDEEEFKRDLATLDADIARIQRSLRETALKT